MMEKNMHNGIQHVLAPHSSPIPPFVWWENTFNEQELNWLQQQALNSSERASVGGNPNSEELKKIRRSHISWLSKTQESSWVFEKLGHVVASINASHYHFNLTGFGESIQLTNYDQSEHGMYGWHVDFGQGPSRKLSLVLQLTDPSQYEGGNLQIMMGGEPVTVRKQRGLIVVFPSFLIHQVTPVTSGNRQSLVSWITGPAFQ